MIQVEEKESWPSDAVRNRLIGDWHLYQRTGGHRTSTDDLIVAWYAVHRCPESPQRYLDLGCGVGSVLLMVSHKLRPVRGIGVEAQAQSAMMAKRSVMELPTPRPTIEIVHSDFRSLGSEDQGVQGSDSEKQGFDLVTGSPPYFPMHTGVLPADAQRRACRFEERGGVEEYVAAAARAMLPNAHFFVVFPSLTSERVLAAANAHGLYVHGRADFWMRRDREAPFLSVFDLAKSPSACIDRFQCPVRDSDGEISPEYVQLRKELGVE